MSVNTGAADQMVQKALIDFAVEHGLTQVHHQPTRNNNILDLVFTTNPSLVKTPSSIPGISDHAMIVTDIDIIPHYKRQKTRKVHLFSKANWEMIYQEMDSLSLTITNQPNSTNIEDLLELLKKGISTIVGRQTICRRLPLVTLYQICAGPYPTSKRPP